MYKILIFLCIASSVLPAQSLPELIQEYENHCNEIVLDTIAIYGYSNLLYVPDTERSGNVTRMREGTVTDTVWMNAVCPVYRYSASDDAMHAFNGAWKYPETDRTIRINPYNGQPIKKVEGTKICEVKRREIQPFSNHFWNWLKHYND